MVHKSHKVPAYHRICMEIDPHSHSTCARLTEIFPPALQDYKENAIIMYLTTLSYTEIFSTMNMYLLVKYELSAEPLSVLYYYLIDVVMEMFNPAGAIIA